MLDIISRDLIQMFGMCMFNLSEGEEYKLAWKRNYTSGRKTEM